MKHYHDCTEVREDLSAYLDDELGKDDADRIAAHLAECADCDRELDALKRVDDAYRGAPAMTAPDDLEEKVHGTVGATGPVGAGGSGRRPPTWMGPIIALAAAGLVVLGGVLILEWQQGQRVQTASAPEAAKPAVSNSAGGVSGAAVPEDGSSAWDTFVQSKDGADVSAEAAPPESDSGTTRAMTDEEVDRLKALGYLNDGDFRKGASKTAEDTSATGEASAERMAESGIAPDRQKVLGQPPESPRPGVAAPEEERQQVALRAGASGDAEPQAQSPAPAHPGELVGSIKLRSFKVRGDGVWYESGYDGEVTIPLERDSEALREVMKQYPDEDWNKMLNRAARQVFQLEGVWYDLEAAPDDGEQ